MNLWEEKTIFKRSIELIIQNSSLEDLQNDSVNMYNVLEPISYLSVIDYANSWALLGDTLSFWLNYFVSSKDTQVDKGELMKNIKECCWAIILSSEFIKKSQETRVKSGDWLKHIEDDSSLWSQIFAVSQIDGIENNVNIKRSLLIFFRAFAEAFFLDAEAKPDTTAVLWEGKWTY